jgi:hypothetical protein
MFSAFGFADVAGNDGLRPKDRDLPGEVEIIAFDETNGVFNFYKELDGRMASSARRPTSSPRAPAAPASPTSAVAPTATRAAAST